MPRHGFMKTQRLERVEGARLRPVRIDPVESGARPVGRRLDISTGGVLRRNLGGNGLDAVWQPRQLPEELRQRAVHALHDQRRFAHELVAGLRLEPRVRPQKLEERSVIALESGLPDDGFHLGSNARDFGEARAVDFLGRDVERRVSSNAVGVIGLPIGEVAGSGRRPRCREVTRHPESQHLAIRRDHRFANGSESGGPEPGPIVARDRLREVGKRLGLDTRFRILDNVSPDRVVVALENDSRKREARGHTLGQE